MSNLRWLVGDEHFRSCQQAYDKIRRIRKERKGPMSEKDMAFHEADKAFETYYKRILYGH